MRAGTEARLTDILDQVSNEVKDVGRLLEEAESLTDVRQLKVKLMGASQMALASLSLVDEVFKEVSKK